MRQGNLIQCQTGTQPAGGTKRFTRLVAAPQGLKRYGLKYAREMKLGIPPGTGTGFLQGFLSTAGTQQETAERPTPKAKPSISRADAHAIAHSIDAAIKLTRQGLRRAQGDMGLCIAWVDFECSLENLSTAIM